MCPPGGGQFSKLWHIHTADQHTAVRKTMVSQKSQCGCLTIAFIPLSNQYLLSTYYVQALF